MDGRLNCSMTADNAAFTKIRHLENRVAENEKRVDSLDAETTQLDETLQNLENGIAEVVETKNVKAKTANIETINATNTINSTVVTADKVKATTIEAETINATSLDNVNTLHGVTVDVERTISDVGKFQETHTENANNDVTNAVELNVANETNLTGQVNVDGNVTFTKDNGVSQLQGNYLEIGASNITLNNTGDGYALYAPGLDGDGLFGGSLVVQDTLLTKNLVALGEVSVKDLELDDTTTLTNPTIKRTKYEDEPTTTALVINNEGKLVTRNVSNEVEGKVASALAVTEEVRSHELKDEWARADENPVYKMPVTDAVQIVLYNSDNGSWDGEGDVWLESEQVEKRIHLTELYGITSLEELMCTTISQGGGILYILKPYVSKDNVLCLNVIKYFASQSLYVMSTGDFPLIPLTYNEPAAAKSDPVAYFIENTSFQPSYMGPVLGADIPTIAAYGTNRYINLWDMELGTKPNTFSKGNTYILTSGTFNKWITFPGTVTTNFYAINGKYNSIRDVARGTPKVINVVDPEDDSTEPMFYVDAPLFGRSSDSLLYLDGGELVTVPFTEIPGYTGESRYPIGTVDRDRNPICLTPGGIIVDKVYKSNICAQSGIYYRDYVSTTISYPEIITINDKRVEVRGSTFYEGEWWDRVVSSARELVEFITKKKEDRRYKVLFLGESIEFDTSDTTQFPLSNYTTSDAYGAFDIYHRSLGNYGLHKTDKYTLKINGTPGTVDKFRNISCGCYWHGFDTYVDINFFGGINPTRWLHINDCHLKITNGDNSIAQEGYQLGISESNNVTYREVEIPEKFFTKTQDVKFYLSDCYNVVFNSWNADNSGYRFGYSNIQFNRCDRCEVNINAGISFVPLQIGAGSNFIYNRVNDSYTTPTLEHNSMAFN